MASVQGTSPHPGRSDLGLGRGAAVAAARTAELSMDAAGWVWGSSPSPQAAPASPSRPLRSSGRHDGTRIGGTASATRSTFSLDTCRAPAATALSPPRGVGRVGAGPAPARKAAPPAGLGPACRCGGAAAPRPLRARYRLRASAGRSSQTRRRSAGTASSPRAAPHQCGAEAFEAPPFPSFRK